MLFGTTNSAVSTFRISSAWKTLFIYFISLYSPDLPHTDGGVPLSNFLKGTTSKLTALSSLYSYEAEIKHFLKS